MTLGYSERLLAIFHVKFVITASTSCCKSKNSLMGIPKVGYHVAPKFLNEF